MKEDLITPYIAHNNDPVYGDGKYYAVDKYGATIGPFESEQEAQEFVDTVERQK